MDARAQRTLNRLHSAVLKLAQTHDISQLSVAEIARAAQINRVTFYNHAASPSALLIQALRPELDGVREHLLHAGAASTGTAGSELSAAGPGNPERPVYALAQHLVTHRSIYQRNLPERGHGVLADFLTQHFAQSVRLVLQDNADAVGRLLGNGQLLSPTGLEATAQFVAHGSVGVIAVWLHADQPLDPGRLVLFLDRLLPPWWLGLGQHPGGP